MWPKEDLASMNAFYGNPDSKDDGRPAPVWEAVNITHIVPPYDMVLAWDTTRKVSSIACHKLVAPSLMRILGRVRDHYGSQEAIEHARAHLYGGAYMFRMMRGSNRLSVHSWGAAIDLDPANNPFGGKVTMDHPVVDAFASEGWVWGGQWRGHTTDGMHFQAATV